MKLFQKISLCAAALVLSGAALVGVNQAKESNVAKADSYTYTDVDITEVHFRTAVGATDYRLMVAFGEGWSNEGAENGAWYNSPALGELNTKTSVHFNFKDGSSYTLGQAYPEQGYFQKIWGENKWATNPLDDKVCSKVADLVSITFDKGCEFPKYGSETEVYRLPSEFSCYNTAGLDGNNMIVFNQARGNLSKLTNIGKVSLIGTSDPGRVDDATPASRFWIEAVNSDWKDNGSNKAVGLNQNLALNFVTKIFYDTKTIASRGTTYAWGLNQESGSVVFDRWAREGQHISFMVEGVTDTRTISTIRITEGTQLPSSSNPAGGYSYEVKYFSVDNTYVFTNNGDGTWNYVVENISGSNLYPTTVQSIYWAKFGDTNVWGMFKIPGINSSEAGIRVADSFIVREYIKNTQYLSKIKVNGENLSSKTAYTNIGLGGTNAQDFAIHFNCMVDDVDTWKTMIIPEGTYFLNATAYGYGEDGSQVSWLYLSKPCVAVNTTSGWQVAEISDADLKGSFMYEGNGDLNGGTKNRVDFAFYVPGLAPEIRTGDANAVSVQGTSIGSQILAAADTVKHIKINGANIPGVYGNSETINWWGRGGNFFGLAVAYEETMMEITSLEVCKGYFIPTAKTVAGTEAKICYVSTSYTFQYAYNSTDRTQQVMTAEYFEEFFLLYTATECDFATVSEISATTFKNIWKYAKRIYNAMSAEEKAALVTSTGAGMQRYDYLVAKYSLENFVNRAQSSNGSLQVVNANSAILIVTIVSVIALAGVLVIRASKRKEDR